jgi:hypothetical protein
MYVTEAAARTRSAGSGTDASAARIVAARTSGSSAPRRRIGFSSGPRIPYSFVPPALRRKNPFGDWLEYGLVAIMRARQGVFRELLTLIERKTRHGERSL